MKNIRVKARVIGPDTNGIQRTTGEIFEMPEDRARNQARAGFVELIDENGAGLAWDAPLGLDRAKPEDFIPPVVKRRSTKKK
jgi:hypothetical protein